MLLRLKSQYYINKGKSTNVTKSTKTREKFCNYMLLSQKLLWNIIMDGGTILLLTQKKFLLSTSSLLLLFFINIYIYRFTLTRVLMLILMVVRSDTDSSTPSFSFLLDTEHLKLTRISGRWKLFSVLTAKCFVFSGLTLRPSEPHCRFIFTQYSK